MGENEVRKTYQFFGCCKKRLNWRGEEYNGLIGKCNIKENGNCEHVYVLEYKGML